MDDLAAVSRISEFQGQVSGLRYEIEALKKGHAVVTDGLVAERDEWKSRASVLESQLNLEKARGEETLAAHNLLLVQYQQATERFIRDRRDLSTAIQQVTRERAEWKRRVADLMGSMARHCDELGAPESVEEER